MTRIVGLDLSMTCTGVTRITANRDSSVVTVHRVTSKPPPKALVTVSTRSHRLRQIAGQVHDLAHGAGLIVVEGPSYASDSGAAHDRAGLWWMIVGRLTGTGHNVVEVPPSSLKTYATGRGNAGKDDVLSAVVRRYAHVEFSGNDEADSLVLAAMGARFAQVPIDGDLPQTHLRAMASVKWQPTTR